MTADSNDDVYKPLAGVRVVDMSRLIVGSLATVKLADLGAEVVKVEPPGIGDYLRTIPPMVDGVGVWHTLLDRNKKSVVLDVAKNEEDRERLRQLIDVADVVVDVSRPGGLKRFGIDIAEHRRRRPQLVACSISPFGQTGPWADIPAHGLNMDSMAGVTALQGEPGNEGFVQLAYTGLGQESAADKAALSIVAAVVGARTSGEGAWIDISCWDAVVDNNRTAIAYLASTGHVPQEDYGSMWGSMHRVYRSKDGKPVFIAVIEKKFWDQFCQAIEREDLLKLWHGEDGGVDYGDLDQIPVIAEIMASRTSDEWLELFVQHGLPGSPLLTVRDVVASDHFAAREILEQVDGQRIANVASPIRWIDRPGGRPGLHPVPPPEVGENTDEVFAEWLGNG